MKSLNVLTNNNSKSSIVSYNLLFLLILFQLFLITSFTIQAQAGTSFLPANPEFTKDQDPGCSAITNKEKIINYNIQVNPKLDEAGELNVVVYDQFPSGSELLSFPGNCELTDINNAPSDCFFQISSEEDTDVLICFIGDITSESDTPVSLSVIPTTTSTQIINHACLQFDQGLCTSDSSRGCEIDSDCPFDDCIVNKCVNNVCEDGFFGCDNDSECIQDNICEDSSCLLTGTACSDDADCDNNVDGTCESNPNLSCTPLTENTVCSGCNFNTVFKLADVSCPVEGQSNVTISKESTSNPEGQCVTANEPSEITYTITLNNIGDAPSSILMLEDQLPQGATVESISFKGDPTNLCTVSNGLIKCDDLGILGADAQAILSVSINITPQASDTQLVNTATVKLSDDEFQTDQAIVCVNPAPPAECNQRFEGVFCDTITVEPDSTILSVSVDTASSIAGIFNTGSLQGLVINGGCSGDSASFIGSLDANCLLTGTLSLINPNLINITGSTSGEGCNIPVTIDASLIRLGSGGGDGDGTNSGNQSGSGSGCSIALSNSYAGAKSMILYLLIPAFLFLRRFKNSVVKKNFTSLKSSKWLKTLLFFSIVPVGFCFIGNSSALAQSNCGTSNFLLSTRADCQETVTSATQPEEVLTQLLSINSQKQFKTIRSHLAELRAGGGSNASLQSLARRMGQLGSTPLLAFNSDATSITNLSLFNQAPENGSDTFSRLGAFVNGSFNFGDRENVNNSGYDFDIFNIIGGLDYRFTDYLIIGASFNYTYTDADLKSSNGQFTSNAYYGTLYGSLYWESFYVDAFGSIGGANYDIERAIDNSLQKGKPSGVLYQLAISTGYEFYKSGFSFTPYGRLEYDQNNLGSYTEQTVSGDPALALKFRKQEVKSFTSALGAQAAYNWSINWGVIRPEILFEWIHEFEDNPDTVTASFVSSQSLPSAPTFSVNPSSVDANFFNLGGGLYAIFPHGFSIFVYYERTLAYNDMNANYITGGLRKEF